MRKSRVPAVVSAEGAVESVPLEDSVNQLGMACPFTKDHERLAAFPGSVKPTPLEGIEFRL